MGPYHTYFCAHKVVDTFQESRQGHTVSPPRVNTAVMCVTCLSLSHLMNGAPARNGKDHTSNHNHTQGCKVCYSTDMCACIYKKALWRDCGLWRSSDVALHKNPVLSPQFGFELRLKSVHLFVKENTEQSSWQVRSPFFCSSPQCVHVIFFFPSTKLVLMETQG